MEIELKHQTALVTGANRGIGRAIVKLLDDAGMTVLMGCRDLDKGNAALHGLSAKAEVVELDLSDQVNLPVQLAAISKRFTNIDIVVNNAGILDSSPFSEITPTPLLHSLQVNALAAATIINHFAPRMQQRRFGRIVNISSGWGSFFEGLEGPPAYAISKATLNAITKTAAEHYSDDWLKINAMCPGWVRTDMGGAEADRTVEEGADTALWLATLDITGPTGQFFRDRKQINW